jgi:hypothetical protein
LQAPLNTPQRAHEEKVQKTWHDALQDAAVSGALAGAATAAVAAACGARESGSALAPLNAISYVLWGERATRVTAADVPHSALGLSINSGASIFWAVLYEKFFGNAADRNKAGAAMLGGAVVAALAYVTDHHLVPKRSTPGWEERLPARPLALVYAALAVSLPLRGLLKLRKET